MPDAAQTKQNRYFVESEHGPEPPEGAEEAAQRFTWVRRWPIYFEPSERNKIKILLRLTSDYAIIKIQLRKLVVTS